MSDFIRTPSNATSISLGIPDRMFSRQTFLLHRFIFSGRSLKIYVQKVQVSRGVSNEQNFFQLKSCRVIKNLSTQKVREANGVF